MAPRRFVTGVAVISALLALGFALYQRSENKKSQAALVVLHSRDVERQEKIARLEASLASAKTLLQESETAGLARPTQAGKTSANEAVASPAVAITRSYVNARYQKAKALAKDGRHTEALAEFLWCYDEGMQRIRAFAGVREIDLLDDIAKLGDNYPPALAALRDRRDEAQRQMVADPADFGSAMSFYSLNRALKESAQTLLYYDGLPPEDPARQRLAQLVYKDLANAQRYKEAAQAKPFKEMLSFFEDFAEPPPLPSGPHSEKTMASLRKQTVELGVGFVEVLAGAGQLTDARDFAEIILAYDGSPGTRAELQRRAAKAGQPELLTGTPAP